MRGRGPRCRTPVHAEQSSKWASFEIQSKITSPCTNFGIFQPSLFVSSSVCWLVLRQKKKKKKSEIELKRLPCPALPLLLRVALRWGGHGV